MFGSQALNQEVSKILSDFSVKFSECKVFDPADVGSMSSKVWVLFKGLFRLLEALYFFNCWMIADFSR